MNQPHLAALYRSPAFLGHETGTHVENPRRILAIDAELERTGLFVDRPQLPVSLPVIRAGGTEDNRLAVWAPDRITLVGFDVRELF